MTDEEVKEFLRDLKIRLAQAEQPPKKDIDDKDEDDDLWLDEMEDMEEEDEDE